MSGFSFGKPPTTNTLGFGSSPFGTSAGTKPAFGVGTASAPLFSPTVTSGSTTIPFSSSPFQNPSSLSLTSNSGFGAAATTSSVFGLSSFSSLAKPSTPLSTSGISTINSFGTNLNVASSAVNQQSVNSSSNFFKPTTTTTNFGSSFTLGLTTPTIATQNTVTTSSIGFGAFPMTSISTGASTTSTANVHVSQPAVPTCIGFGVSSASLPSTATASTAAAMTSFNFGNPSLSALAKSTANPGFETSSLGLAPRTLTGTTIATSATGTTSCATATIVTTSVPSVTTAPSLSVASSQTLTYNQLEELVNKWTLELEDQERYFFDEVDRINQWDQTLICNAENITAMHEKVEMCQCEQSRLEQELDFIEGQQRELEGLLEPLERAVNELPPGQLHSDYEREAIFQLATNVDLELGQLLSDLREIADQTNTTTMNAVTGLNSSDNNTTTTNTTITKESSIVSGNNSKLVSSNGGDIMNQITRILNCHMHSLNWIHHNTQEIMDRLKVLNGVS
uniref:Nuclear pore glycoprotein p62 n=1 Tax=Schistosoma japonicum TaxID=6182 RepID=C1LG43_SCHJA|nr:Nuclear pore glycoprotein p62 [Schistosoma japonicum]CAX73671.1 Nuclear pore glycoprotein p62 [Schistosoma japonicum]